MKTGIKNKPAKLGRCGSITNAEGHLFRSPEYMKIIQEHPDAKGHFDLVAPSDKNEYYRNPKYSGGLLALLDRDKREAAAHSKTGKAPTLGTRKRINKKTGQVYEVECWTPIREGCCPVKPDTTLKDFYKFVKWMNSKGIGVISIGIHRDEGHIDLETGETIINNHAHLQFDYINHATGKTVKLTDQEVSEMQTVLAESLGMERGEKKEKTHRKHISAEEYRAQKVAEENARLEAKNQELKNYEPNLLGRLRNSKEKELVEKLGTLEKENEGLRNQVFFLKKELNDNKDYVRLAAPTIPPTLKEFKEYLSTIYQNGLYPLDEKNYIKEWLEKKHIACYSHSEHEYYWAAKSKTGEILYQRAGNMDYHTEPEPFDRNGDWFPSTKAALDAFRKRASEAAERREREREKSLRQMRGKSDDFGPSLG